MVRPFRFYKSHGLVQALCTNDSRIGLRLNAIGYDDVIVSVYVSLEMYKADCKYETEK